MVMISRKEVLGNLLMQSKTRDLILWMCVHNELVTLDITLDSLRLI